MKQKRLAGYIEDHIYQEFIKTLREDGMTFSGWLRRMIKEYLDRRAGE